MDNADINASIETFKKELGIRMGIKAEVLRIFGEMESGTDYGQIPKTKKRSLYKVGAERLLFELGLQFKYTGFTPREIKIEGEKYPVVIVDSKFEIFTPDGSILLGYAIGCSTSAESKYSSKTLWLSINKLRDQFPDLDPASLKTEDRPDSFNPGKTYKVYAIEESDPNPYRNLDNLYKMARKRAVVPAVLMATGSAYLFNAELDENGGDRDHGEGGSNKAQPQSRGRGPSGESSGDNKALRDDCLDLVKKCEREKALDSVAAEGWNKTIASGKEGTLGAMKKTLTSMLEKKINAAQGASR